MRWAKTEIDSLGSTEKNDVLVFRNKIEKVDRELDSSHKHLLAAYMELVQVKGEIESLSERKQIYSNNLDDMEQRYNRKKKGKIFKLLMRKIKNAKSPQGSIH